MHLSKNEKKKLFKQKYVKEAKEWAILSLDIGSAVPEDQVWWFDIGAVKKTMDANNLDAEPFWRLLRRSQEATESEVARVKAEM